MKIMLVDDSETVRDVCKSLLINLGYIHIVEACDGMDAKQKVFFEKPDLILLDWNMPNVNGLEFLKSFREVNDSTPIIMMTTESDKDKVLLAIESGVNNYIIKPFEADELATRIKQTLTKAADYSQK